MTRLLAAALFMIWAAVSGCSTLQWARQDQALFAVNLGCHAWDYAQTSWAMDRGGFTEANPLLGESPSDERLLVFKSAVAGASWWMADQAGDKRTTSLITLTATCLAVVAHNYSEGARP